MKSIKRRKGKNYILNGLTSLKKVKCTYFFFLAPAHAEGSSWGGFQGYILCKILRSEGGNDEQGKYIGLGGKIKKRKGKGKNR